MMAVVGGLVVTLCGVCLVLLAAIHRRLGCLSASAEAAAQHRAEEDRKHREATAAIAVAAVREVGGAIVRELQRAADERRAAVQHLMQSGLGPDSRPMEYKSVLRDAPMPWDVPCAADALPASQPRPVLTPGASTLPPDAPTPRSGYPVAAWRAEPEGDAHGAHSLT